MEFNFKSSDIAKHSAAHVLGAAVKRIFPNVKFGLGPVTKSGFYYDFDLERPLTSEDLELIEKNIAQIISEDLPFQQTRMDRQAGIDMLLQIGQMYKAEVIKAVPEDEVSFYKLGEEFIDLCRGPHLKSTGEVGIVKLLSTEEKNWNNDPSRPVMYRIHGVVFQNITEYKEYLKAAKLQEKRDIIKLSTSMNYIFRDNDYHYFTETGSDIVKSIKNFILSHFSKDQNKVIHLPSKISYKDAFRLIDGSTSHKNLSYKDLPKTVSGELDQDNEVGLTTPAIITKHLMQKGRELVDGGDFLESILDICTYIAKQDVNIIIRCTDLDNKIVKNLSLLLQKRIISHNKILTDKINGVAEIEVTVTDSVGKEWSLCRGFIPNIEKLNVKYRTNNNIIDTASEFGFYFDVFAIYSYLLEEFEYDIPYKFKPTQAIVIAKSNKQESFASSIYNHLSDNGIRVKLDNSSKSLNQKIRRSENRKIPFILIVGPKEETNNAVAIRSNNSEIGLVSNENLIKFINENKEKSK